MATSDSLGRLRHAVPLHGPAHRIRRFGAPFLELIHEKPHAGLAIRSQHVHEYRKCWTMVSNMTDRFIQIRGARIDDADAVTAVLAETYPVAFADAYPAELLAVVLPLITRSNPALLRSGCFWVSENADRQIVGCGGWSLERPGSGEIVGGVGHVRHFATHPDWARRGIGRALLSRSVTQAKERGTRILECHSSLVAEPFYRSNGFAFIGKIEVEFAPGVTFPGVHMRLSIV
jgi:GNAT superfamily N-acetyltransferase